MKITTSMSIAALGLGLAACGGPAEDTSAQLFSETAVSWNADGSPNVTTRWVTAAQQQAENQARAGQDGAAAETGSRAQALVADPLCKNRSVWIYDQAGWTGNKICLEPTPPSQSTPEWNLLRTFPRPVSLCTPFGGCHTLILDWERAVRSYWDPDFEPFYTGRHGVFATSPCTTFFEMDGLQHVADACVRSAIWIGTFAD